MNATYRTLDLSNADPSGAIAGYRAVTSRMPFIESDKGNNWNAVEQYCEDEIAAIQAVADAPHGGITNLLRKVIILAERNKLTGWSMMDCEKDLVESVATHARTLLIGGGA